MKVQPLLFVPETTTLPHGSEWLVEGEGFLVTLCLHGVGAANLSLLTLFPSLSKMCWRMFAPFLANIIRIMGQKSAIYVKSNYHSCKISYA